eukprot:scaffold86084_cov14-Prasinocladus_malaysianus.AAC.1
MMRTMLHTANLPAAYWACGMHAAVHIRNRIWSEGANGIPYELLYGSPPDLSHLRVFGCKAYVHIPRELRRKMDDRAWLGVFVGYPVDSPGYLIFNPRKGRSSYRLTYNLTRLRNITSTALRFGGDCGRTRDTTTADRWGKRAR